MNASAKIAGTVRGLLRSSKDGALALTARSFLNSRLQRIGQITDLAIDTKASAVQCRVRLAGESKPIDIHVRKYRLKANDDKVTLTMMDATSSREWLTGALNAFVVGRHFRIPPKAGAALKLLA